MLKIEELRNSLRKRPGELKRLRSEGKKVVGYFPGDYVPEELIHSAGAIPICFIHGGDPESVEAAHVLVSRFVCPFARAQFGYRVIGEQPYYELLDMLAAPITCQNLRRTADLWNHTTDLDVFRIGVPHAYNSEDGLKYFYNTLIRFREKLEQVTGNRVEEEKLKNSINLYNRLRGLLREISLLRTAQDLAISMRDFVFLNHASYLLDPDLMVNTLDSLLNELKTEGPARSGDGRARILLTGPCLALGDMKILDLVDESGGDVVVEEVCEGLRCYWENVDVKGDQIQNLAVRYLQKRWPAAFMRMSAQPRLENILSLVEDFRVDGVLWYQLKYCETYDFECFYAARKLEEKGVPFIKLESEYDVSDRGPLKTRIEAFIESLTKRRS